MNCRLPIAEFRFRNPRGFSFTEILFAVMILGIGFIMVAAMFPVAIRQTEANSREAITASVSYGGASALQQIGLSPWPPLAPPGAATNSFLQATYPQPPAIKPPASILGNSPDNKLPAGATQVIIPGQVWDMFDARNGWTYTYPASVGPPLANTTISNKQLLWRAVSNNLVQAGDPRYAWVGLYRRDLIVTGPAGGVPTNLIMAPNAQVIIIGTQARAVPEYKQLASATAATPLLPVLITGASLKPSPANSATPSSITFPNPVSARIAPDSYVIVSVDHFPAGTPPAWLTGLYNGRVYRLGNQLSATQWEFAPGNGMDATDPPLPNADVFVVGRGFDATGAVTGPAQDISVYTTFVQVPN